MILERYATTAPRTVPEVRHPGTRPRQLRATNAVNVIRGMTKGPGNSRKQLRLDLRVPRSRRPSWLISATISARRRCESASTDVVNGGDVTGNARTDRGDLAGHEVDRRGERLGVEIRYVTTTPTRRGSPNAFPEPGSGTASSRGEFPRARCRRPHAIPNRAAGRRVTQPQPKSPTTASDRCRVATFVVKRDVAADDRESPSPRQASVIPVRLIPRVATSPRGVRIAKVETVDHGLRRRSHAGQIRHALSDGQRGTWSGVQRAPQRGLGVGRQCDAALGVRAAPVRPVVGARRRGPDRRRCSKKSCES